MLPVSVNLPLLTTLGSYRFPTHVHSFSPCFDLQLSQLHDSLFPLCYKMYLPHTPAIALHVKLSLSLPPSLARYMHRLCRCPLSFARTHIVYLGHSLEIVSLFLPHGGPHSLSLALFIRVSFNLVFFHTQMIHLPVRASIDTLYTLARRLSI